MLKSMDQFLNADVLYALRSMGHGDDLVITDTNFPADSVARQSVLGRLLRIDNVSAGRAARAGGGSSRYKCCRGAQLAHGLR